MTTRDGPDITRPLMYKPRFRYDAACRTLERDYSRAATKKRSVTLNLFSPEADRQMGPPNWLLRLEGTGPANADCHVGVET